MGTRNKKRPEKSSRENKEEPKKEAYPLISLFTGAGGLDLGLEEAGFDTRVCVEFDKCCVKTLRKNRPSWEVIDRDINAVSTNEILKVPDLNPGETVLLSAGPPCQSFSNLGKQKGLEDPRGRLLLKTLELIKEIRPLAFIVENVEGLATMRNGEILKEALKVFKINGYGVNHAILNTADYGVPQKRKRIFFLGHREGKKLLFPEPEYGKTPGLCNKKRWKTVGETLKELYSHKGWDKRPDNMGFKHTKKVIERIKMIKPGENFKSLPDYMRPECWRNGKHQGADTFGRLKADEPSVTIRTAAYNPTKGRYIHPWENRGLTTLEMAALQTFPYEYTFEGSLVEIGKQIGNAVPPLIAKKIGESILEQIKNDIKK